MQSVHPRTVSGEISANRSKCFWMPLGCCFHAFSECDVAQKSYSDSDPEAINLISFPTRAVFAMRSGEVQPGLGVEKMRRLYSRLFCRAKGQVAVHTLHTRNLHVWCVGVVNVERVAYEW